MNMNTAIESGIPFVKLIGVKISVATKTLVEAELKVTPQICTTGNILHGGAVMAFADSLGGIGAFLNLPKDAITTTTVESKTNFVGAAKEGITVKAIATPIHIGRRTSVWQTRISRVDDDKLIALVTQTQMAI